MREGRKGDFVTPNGGLGRVPARVPADVERYCALVRGLMAARALRAVDGLERQRGQGARAAEEGPARSVGVPFLRRVPVATPTARQIESDLPLRSPVPSNPREGGK